MHAWEVAEESDTGEREAMPEFLTFFGEVLSVEEVAEVFGGRHLLDEKQEESRERVGGRCFGSRVRAVRRITMNS